MPKEIEFAILLNFIALWQSGNILEFEMVTLLGLRAENIRQGQLSFLDVLLRSSSQISRLRNSPTFNFGSMSRHFFNLTKNGYNDKFLSNEACRNPQNTP